MNSSSGAPSIAHFIIGGGQYIFKSVFYEDDTLDLTIYDGWNVWNVSHASIEDDIRLDGGDMQDYVDQLKSALQSQDLCGERFAYTLEQHLQQQSNEGIMTLTIGFILEGSIGELKAARICLKKSEIAGEANYQFMRELLANVRRLREDLRSLTAKASQRDEARDVANRAIEEKLQLEQTLFSQFAVVINEKKKKIREMQKEYERVRRENEALREQVTELRSRPMTPFGGGTTTPLRNGLNRYYDDNDENQETPRKRRNLDDSIESLNDKDLLDLLGCDF